MAHTASMTKHKNEWLPTTYLDEFKKFSTPSTLSYCDGWRSRRVLRVRCLIGNAGGKSSSSLIFENDDERSDKLNLVDAIETELKLLLTNALSMQSWLVVAVRVWSLSLHFENRSVAMPLVLVPPNVDVDIEFSSCDCWWYWLMALCWWCMPVWSLKTARCRVATLCMLARIECIDTKPVDVIAWVIYLYISAAWCMNVCHCDIPDSLEFLWFFNVLVCSSDTGSDGVFTKWSSFTPIMLSVINR